MTSYFQLCDPDLGSCREVMCMQDWYHSWAIRKEAHDSHLFFQELAEKILEFFQPQFVTIWDNCHYCQSIVLHASAPDLDSIITKHILSLENSFTGLTIDQHMIIVHDSFTDMIHGRTFEDPHLLKELNIVRMVSIPISLPRFSPIVSFVMNLHYSSGKLKTCSVTESDMNRISRDLGHQIERLMYRRDEEIRKVVARAGATATGISSLFDEVLPDLKKMCRCVNSAILTWDPESNELYTEKSSEDEIQRIRFFSTQQEINSVHADQSTDQDLISVCVDRKSPLMSLRYPSSADHTKPIENHSLNCNYMAFPVKSTSDTILAVLRCTDSTPNSKGLSSFNSVDLHALQEFACALSPHIERLLRIRHDKNTLAIVKKVSSAMVAAYQLEEELDNSIRTLVPSMHSEVGSIYLLDEKTKELVMCAAEGPNRQLIGKARYNIGEGITGEIALGKTLNLKSSQEILSHPSYKGKYDDQIWKDSSSEGIRTLLGVPIKAGEKVIGVWKLGNVKISDNHRNPYYTDEDEQVALILSCFLSYVIQNHRTEATRKQQFKLLAQASIDIQAAQVEDEAISAVLTSLQDTGVPDALFSRYNPKAKTITPVLSFGNTWSDVGESYSVSLNDSDVRAEALRSGQEMIIRDSRRHKLCKADKNSKIHLVSQFVLPLLIGDEIYGTLQIDLGDRASNDTVLDNTEALIFRAFASHLILALSRISSISRAMELTNQVMASSRFLTAETLSAMAIHSVHHKIHDIREQIKKDLEEKHIRENKILLISLTKWDKNLTSLVDELKRILTFVRAPTKQNKIGTADLNAEVQKSIDIWINYIHSVKASIKLSTDAKDAECDINPWSFREIMAVLLVNSAQAYAHNIHIMTYNGTNVLTSSGTQVPRAFCLECADDGIGITVERSEDIFSAAYTTKSDKFGTGLGLFIARRLARTAGGDLELLQKHRFTKGVTFKLILPLSEVF